MSRTGRTDSPHAGEATRAAALPRPGPVHGPYPQRQTSPKSVLAGIADRLGDLLASRGPRARRRRSSFLAALQGRLQSGARGADLRAEAAEVARRLAREGLSPDAVAHAQAVVAIAVEATLGYRPYPTQHLAAFEALEGRLVEMDTGEGKSLAILLAAGTLALARVPVHVITANGYLAERDAATADRVLDHLGLRAGAIRHDMDSDARRAVHALAVAYATVQEIGFDYLRDRQAAGVAPPVLRGLCFALVDEADSILIDHARTPLVLARPSGDDTPGTEAIHAAWRFTASLRPGIDCRIDAHERRAEIAPAILDRLPPALASIADARVQVAALRDALVARHVLQRDAHYLVDGGGITLLDANTGRKLPGTTWPRGLQHMVHVKEGLPPPDSTRTATQITLQTLLGRYMRLAGVSGTLREARWPLWLFFGLATHRVAPRLDCRRRQLGLRLYAHRDAQLDAIARRTRALAGDGRAVLIGTDTVANADALSRGLAARGIAHRLLTARDDDEEAALIARAGGPGIVTVATHIAGRGTDIALASATLEAGGLHVICCAQSGSARIDRQLAGRAARNGQPGSCETVLSLDDPEFAANLPPFLISAACWRSDITGKARAWLAPALPAIVHLLNGLRETLRTAQLVRQDRLTRRSLTFAPLAE